MTTESSSGAEGGAALEGAHRPPTTASDTVLTNKPPTSPTFARQNTVPSPTQMVMPKSRNPRGLTLPSPISPTFSSSSGTTVQPNQFQSLGEGAASLAAHAPATPLRPASPSTPLLGHPQGTSPLPATSPTVKAKGKLKSLLPRSHHQAHSYFHAKVEIEQLASVPFVRGEFGVRWKFKSSVSPGEIKGERLSPPEDESGGLLGKMKVRSMTGKGKAKEDGHGSGEFGLYQQNSNSSSPHLASEGSRTTTLNSFSSYSSGESFPTRTSSTATTSTDYTTASTTTNASSKTVSAPNGNLSRNFFSSRPGETSPSKLGANQYLYSHTESAESAIFSPDRTGFGPSNAADPLSPGWEGAMSPNVLSPTGTITQANAASHPMGYSGAVSPRNPAYGAPSSTLSPSKGLVPYRPLKDHSITYNFPLNAIVKLDIARGSSSGPDGKLRPNLQPNEFKLVVIQRVIPDDPDGPPQNPRLGAIYLNLAEYVGKGRVERRYLLKESRVNATLKLSIELTYVSGNNEYVAPPLPKAEIMGGIENFLVQNENLNKQRTKDIYGYTYGPYRDQEELEVDLLGQTNDDGSGLDTGSLKAPQDPYALPSESESELDSEQGGVAGGVDQSRRMFLRSISRSATMSSDPRGQQQSKATLTPREVERMRRRQARREERQTRFKLELERNPYAIPPSSGENTEESEEDEKEGDEAISDEGDGFESAPEDEGVRGDTESLQQTEESCASSAGYGSSQEQHQRHYKPRGTNPDIPSFTSFDVQRLPLAFGPKTTEVLIDALFNPVLTTDKTKENPFTLYVSPADLAQMKDEERKAFLESHGGRERLPMRAPTHAATMKPNGRSYSHAASVSTATSESGRSHDSGDQLEGMRSPDTIVQQKRSPTGLFKSKEGGGKRGQPKRSETTRTSGSSVVSHSPNSANVLGSPVFVQEPAGMDSEEVPGPTNRKAPRRSGTVESGLSSVRANNSSSTSLSSTNASRSGHGHGASGNLTPVSRPLTRQNTDVSVPDGRMDRTGFVKGVGGAAPAHGLGSSINRWWKGLGGHGSAPHSRAGTPTAVAS